MATWTSARSRESRPIASWSCRRCSRTSRHQGRDGLRRMWEAWRDSFDRFRMEIEEVIDAEDRVVVMARACGIGRDSGVEVRTPSFPLIWTVRDHEVVRVTALPTRAAALEAVGLSE